MIQIAIETTLALTLLFCIYKAFLESAAMHKFKRFYLLLSVPLAFALPFLHIQIERTSNLVPSSDLVSETIFDPFFVVQPSTSSDMIINEHVQSDAQQSDSLSILISVVYILVALALLFKYFKNIFRPILLARTKDQITQGRIRIVLVDEQIVPHNFMHLIFMNRAEYHDESLRERLMAHELSHARQYHSVDLLFIELLKTIFWFNPIFYLVSRAMRLNHEYLADAMALKSTNDVVSYQQLLLQYSGRDMNRQHQLISSMSFALTKKRFRMMGKTISQKGILVRMLVITPLISITMLLSMIETRGEMNTSYSESDPRQYSNLAQSPNYKPDILPSDPELYKFRISSDLPVIFNSSHPRLGDEDPATFRSKYTIPVRATAPGVVTEYENHPKHMGKFIRIQHGETYTTVYGLLNNSDVRPGQKVNKGDVIGSVLRYKLVGAPVVYYEIHKDNVRQNLSDYLKSSESEALKSKRVIEFRSLVRDQEVMKKYGLMEEHFMVNFFPDYEFKKIVYDAEKAVFFKQNGEILIKTIADISVEQLQLIQALRLPPLPPPGKRRPIKAIVDNWHDAKQFGIWIDGKRVENTEMSQYSASDFSYHYVSELKKNAINYGKHRYQLNLTTSEMFEERLESMREATRKWKKSTRAILDKLNID